jgi:glycosyltransferase involved in cell wall biosynthesis
LTSSQPTKPLHLHIAGWSGTSQSIALVNQWQTLALSRRPDVRLTRQDIAAHFPPDEVFSPTERARLSAIAALAPGEAPDAEIRTPYQPDQPAVAHPVLAFAVAEVRGSIIRNKSAALRVASNVGRRILTVPSNWVRDGFVEQGLPSNDIVVVPHGVSVALYRPSQAKRAAVRTQLGLKRFTFLHVGGMHMIKGVDLVLKGLAILLQRGLPVQLLLKGQDSIYKSDGILANVLKSLTEADRNRVYDNTVYLGQSLNMSAMATLYNAADAYVAPYRAEGFCLPVLEAAACGLPIIATGGGATDDFTTDDFRWPVRASLEETEHGELLQPDLDHLVELMSRMVTARDFHNRASKAGPRHVAANYTWDHVAARIVEIVRSFA